MSNSPKFELTTGSKAQVFHGTAKHTVGGLTKSDLMQTNAGRIVSKKQHEAGKKALQRLRNAGYVAKKGEFKLFTKKSKSRKSAKPTRTRAQHTRSFTASVKAKKAATRASRKANKGANSTRKSN